MDASAIAKNTVTAVAPNVNGNFAVGQYITPTSMTDPAAVDAALKSEIASGRGLAIIAGLGLNWGVETDERGKTIWIEART